MIGKTLGPYHVLDKLGEGGMGEVYRAHDTRLNRDVAVKVLPEGVASDPERRARLEREAQTVAALSHPNVLAVFDTGIHDGQLYVVTELLDGETLRERLLGGPLTPRKAIETAVEIARGLAAAHDKQLIHRDLKPENVFLVADGRVKILDFGLARHVASTGDASETVAAMTDPGTVLGTVGYMAPEQVRNQPIDARADLFAFGAVLYEMLTGRRAFRRDTHAETMTAILREDPPELLQVRPDLPPALERIVRHCLEKNLSDRFQTARDVAFALDALSGSGTTTTTVPAVGAPAVEQRRRLLPWLVAGGAVVTLAIVMIWVYGSTLPDQPSMTIGTATQVTTDDGLEIDPSLSADGKHLAYAAGPVLRTRIYRRAVAGGKPLPLTDGTVLPEFQPRWSPDGNRILYLAGHKGVMVGGAVRVVPEMGGESQFVASGDVTAAAWSHDGQEILLVRGDTLSAVPFPSVAERTIGKIPDAHSCVWSRANRIACVQGNRSGMVPGPALGNIAPSKIVTIPASGGAPVDVTEGEGFHQSPVWGPDGRELFFISSRHRTRDIYVGRILPDGRPDGEPTRITSGLNLMSIALSAYEKRLAYVAYSLRANIWTLPIPKGGPVDASTATSVTSGNQVVEQITVSPDERWLLYDSDRLGNADIYRIPITGGEPKALTTDQADNFAPDLSPDGRFITFHSYGSGEVGTKHVFIQSVDGGAAEALAPTKTHQAFPVWSPNGNAIAFLDQGLEAGVALGPFVVHRSPSGGWGKAQDLLRRGAGRPNWLDDQTLVYTLSGSIESMPALGGKPYVLYTPAPGSAEPQAMAPLPSEDGRVLYFVGRDADGQCSLWSIPRNGGKPRPLVTFGPSRPFTRCSYAAGAGRFFFRSEDHQSDISVAEVTRRVK